MFIYWVLALWGSQHMLLLVMAPPLASLPFSNSSETSKTAHCYDTSVLVAIIELMLGFHGYKEVERKRIKHLSPGVCSWMTR